MHREDLVLLGGGHTHVLLIKALAMRPIPGVRVTLVSEKTLTPYSGMLPGFVAGHYSLEQTNIDLNALCRKAGVRWITARCEAIDADNKRLNLGAQPDLEFDVLSVDIGSTPDQRVVGASEFAVGVKPIAGFQQRWQNLLSELEASSATARKSTEQSSEPPREIHWGVVGAGAGGVELVLAMAHRLRRHTEIRFHLIFRGERILADYPKRVISRVERALEEYNIQLHAGFSVEQVTETGVTSDAGERIALDTSIWCTGAVGAPWLASGSLATTDKNFIEITPALQSTSHDTIFAVGDIAANVEDPRPKAGVFAVRQAPFLEDNLRRFFAGKSLKAANLQTQYLSLLALGEKTAVASRNGFALSGRWAWKWKDHIDQKFMRQFADMKMTSMDINPVSTADKTDDPQELMHCGGCASKLGPSLLTGNLAKLNPVASDALQIEDAVLWQATPGTWSVQSIDGFRSFISDESRFAQICVNHALSDLYAMGASPVHVQAWINLAFNDARLQQRDHLRVLQAMQSMLSAQNTTLSGGHSSEGSETHLGIVANGEVDLDVQWLKSGSRAGDVIVLSKSLGTGVIMAADMQGQAPAESVDGAINSMLISNMHSMAVLSDHQPSAVTDVTGFGLLGHLLEMLDGNKNRLVAELDLPAIPLLDGALELSMSGWRSSLYPQLEPCLTRCKIAADPKDVADTISLLLDPQTSGGLLATLSAANAARLLERSNHFVCIGNIVNVDSQADEQKSIRVSSTI